MTPKQLLEKSADQAYMFDHALKVVPLEEAVRVCEALEADNVRLRKALGLADVVIQCKHSFVCDKCKISTPIDQNNHGGVCFMCSRVDRA